MTTTTLTTSRRPLLCRYPRRAVLQPAYLSLADDGDVWTDWDAEIGGTPPNTVWHRRTLRWQIVDPSLTRGEIDALLDAAGPLLARVHAGHTVDWDGSNDVGYLSDDATAASESLATLCRDAHSTTTWDEDLDGELDDFYDC